MEPQEPQKLVIDLSGMSGLVDRFYGDYAYQSPRPYDRIIGEDGQYADGVFNPIARLGQFSPAPKTYKSFPSETSAIVGATISDNVNQKPYFLDRGDLTNGRLYSAGNLASYLGAITVNRVISGAVGTDLELYTVSGARGLFYTYQKAGGGNMGFYNLASGYNDTHLSTSATSGLVLGATSNHKLIVADNGYMYILDGSAIHKFDGTTSGGTYGSATMNAILFPAMFQLVDGIDLRGKLWVLLTRSTLELSGETGSFSTREFTGVYVWDRKTTTSNFTDFIPISGVKEGRVIFDYEGTPGVFVISSTNYTQLRLFDGNRFVVEKELGLDAYPLFHDSVVVSGGMIKWQGKDGIFYAYGSVTPKGKKQIFKLGDASTEVSASAGSLVKLGGAILDSGGLDKTSASPYSESYTLSFTDSANTTYLRKFYPHATNIDGNLIASTATCYTKVYLLPKLSNVKGITLFYPKKSNAVVTDYNIMALDVYLNHSSTSWGTTHLTKIADGNRGHKYIKIGQPNINSIQISHRCESATVEEALKLMYAVVEYLPSSRLE